MRVNQQITIHAPPEAVWAKIIDPVNVLQFMAGITRWEVQGKKAIGLGARYAMRMHVGSAEVGGLIEVVEFDEPRDMAWTSITGLDQRGRWRLRSGESGNTRVELRLSYHAPGGILAALSDRLSAPIVRRNLRASLLGLKRRVEADQLRETRAQRAARRRRKATR